MKGVSASGKSAVRWLCKNGIVCKFRAEEKKGKHEAGIACNEQATIERRCRASASACQDHDFGGKQECLPYKWLYRFNTCPMPPPFPTKRMLGIDFFIGTPAEAVAHISKAGGLVIAPAAPSFVALQGDPDYRRAIADADLAIADSGWAVLFWRWFKGEKITRISGLAIFRAFLETFEARAPRNVFFVLPSEKAKTRTLQ